MLRLKRISSDFKSLKIKCVCGGDSIEWDGDRGWDGWA